MAKHTAEQNTNNRQDAAMQKRLVFMMDLLRKNPGGVRFNAICAALHKEFGITLGASTAAVRELLNSSGGEVIKPERGLYALSSLYNGGQDNLPPVPASGSVSVSESDFYQSFADWLIDEVGECTTAIPLGGARFGGKWGTPDVIGALKPSAADIIKELEITSAEIKKDTGQLITAFGQACAYKLFSHRVYLVIPRQSNADEIIRLDSLCPLFGIGLVLFDNANPDYPDFQIRNRARKGLPDNYYANENLKIIAADLDI
jgi:hypothetical protein